jgi:hypothetical protein
MKYTKMGVEFFPSFMLIFKKRMGKILIVVNRDPLLNPLNPFGLDEASGKSVNQKNVEKKMCKINLFILIYFPGLEDGRLDSGHMSGLYGHRSNSSASSSPPAGVGQSGQGGDGGLIVPQPVNAKHHGHHTNGGGGGRKYQCKMCPQVGKVRDKISKVAP